ncbi:complement regulator-acquiring protein [Borrelia venezuelensis]|uniref:complement regulator-acquiring protein n=1 Tax=Borrelia venezuelensis TaxID=1653839 RepID=UPI001FF522A6|nr:complement regulator-acquiring protein [Borrelia venezuelensis]UPA12595.1 complement regulator-acquiring protein [Borrelia venezuelensis]
MKNKVFIMSFIIIFTLTACKSDLNEQRTKGFNYKTQKDCTQSIHKDGTSSIQQIQQKCKKEVNTKAKQILIDFLRKQVQNVTALIEKDKKHTQKNEPADQFGMKNGVFKIVIGNPSQKAYNNPESQSNRRQFYSSLNYNEVKIRKLGIILNQITSDDINRGQLHIDITNAGRAYSQFLFERVIDKIKDVQDKLDSLNFKDLKKIKTKFDEIAKLKLLWKNTADNIIKDYDNDADGIKTDSQKLIEYIREKYGNIFQKEIPKIGILVGDINKILKMLN